MTDIAQYDPADPLAAGRTVIEASAGTGKTYAIAAQVTRLIAVEGIELGEILVVTFTRAATAELKSRVRDRLRSTTRLLDGRDPAASADRFDQAILDLDEEERSVASRRLADALTHFDDAQIFTIHGFAQRLLRHLGFRSRLSPDLEAADIDRKLLSQVASDFIVARFADNPAGDNPSNDNPSDDRVPKLSQLTESAKAVVGTPDATIVPDADAVDGLARTRVEMAHSMSAEMTRRLRSAGMVPFDDGLVEARDALVDPEIGDAARALLQGRYAIALVDEAQDTDPVQWQIIRAVFDGARMVVVGDPKQSIYSFRGADVESYLAAVDGADAARTLGINWRSDGPLIAALDAVFDGAEFGDSRIVYRPVQPAPGHESARLTGPGAPLAIHRFHDDIDIARQRNGSFYIDDARNAVADDVAAEIVGLLTSRATITDEEGDHVVGPADLAVLCRTRRQVDMVRRALADRDVPSVTSRTGGVHSSDAATQWQRFLLAIDRPDRADLARLAATTLLVGHSPAEVAGFDDEDVLALQHRIATWQRILGDSGVPALVADLHQSTGLAARVLALPDGERVMTDLAHVAEEMHALWRRGRIGSLAAWLEGAMAESGELASENAEEPESRQRRLETDADAVQVQTIHGSKGLEYPVVFVPFAWDGSARSPTIPIFHDPQAVAGDTPRPRLIDVSGGEGPDFANHRTLAMAEDAAEEGRLLYVALTRAKHRLHVWWIERANTTSKSKLHQLLTRDGRTIEQLAESSAGTIELTVLEDLPTIERYQPPTATAVPLARAQFDRHLDHAWQRASFTSLSTEHPLASTDTSEHPVRADEEVDNDAQDEPVPTSSVPILPMAELPRGARFGNLVHEVLEHVPIDAPDLSTAVRTQLEVATRRSAWDLDDEAFINGIVATMTTPLGPADTDLRLVDLDPARTFAEMTFEIPVHTEHGAVQLSDIGDLMLEHLRLDDPYRPYGEHLRRFAPRRFRGYLAGAIDLTAAIPTTDGDRYVVMDYKSNTLPPLADLPAPADYGPGPLADVMITGNYVLQATLYQVALHRYLQWRLPGYDPAMHLGGSMYLFVRGMVGDETPVIAGERCGVARWHPPASFIVALSELFKGPPS